MLVVSTFCITLRFDRALLELEAIDSHFGLDELLLKSIVLKCEVLLLVLKFGKRRVCLLILTYLALKLRNLCFETDVHAS